MIRIKKILCPIDFSPAALKAADYAAALAKNYGAKIQLLRVIAPVAYYEYGLSPVDTIKAMEEASSAEMKKLVTRLTAKGVSVETKMRTGDVQDETRRSISAAKPDLIAMGTHGRRGFARWVMGSVTESMMRHSDVKDVKPRLELQLEAERLRYRGPWSSRAERRPPAETRYLFR